MSNAYKYYLHVIVFLFSIFYVI